MLTKVRGYLSAGGGFAYSAIVNTLKGTSREELLINYVFQHAKENSAESVINAIDEFAWKRQFLMVNIFPNLVYVNKECWRRKRCPVGQSS